MYSGTLPPTLEWGVVASCGFVVVAGPVVRAALSAFASLRARSPLAFVCFNASFSMSLALFARGILCALSGSSSARMVLDALICSASVWEVEVEVVCSI